ncbi:MAG: hypothetical protein H6561_13545 [Lewinellaceae bacterium]|nr:hypothetical protein [Lewinellaceae bacterium]
MSASRHFLPQNRKIPVIHHPFSNFGLIPSAQTWPGIPVTVQADAYTFRYKRLTNPTWNTQATISTPSDLLTNLLEDEEYEVQCQLTCGNTNSAWSLSYYFRTEAGPCAEPLLSDLQVLNSGDSAVRVNATSMRKVTNTASAVQTILSGNTFREMRKALALTSGLHANTEYHPMPRVLCPADSAPGARS